MGNTKEFGNKGEDIAIDYLIQKGYIILARNFVSGKNEVDIIARNKGEVVFIEVKTRATSYFCEPEYAVKMDKQRAIIKVANSYIFKNKVMEEARFDIISIIISDTETKINHIERAFEPTLY
ncbi:MAG: YraN family protein [Bacteroidales bacterium]